MLNKDIHKGHRQRLRERIAGENFNELPDYIALEYVLMFVIPRRDVNPIAHELLNKFKSLKSVLNSSVDELIKIEGVKETVAQFLMSYKKILTRIGFNNIEERIVINNTNDAMNFAKRKLIDLNHEELLIAYLDKNNILITTSTFSSLNSKEVPVQIRIINSLILKNNVSSLVISHNHPTGASLPSAEDNVFTKRICTLASNLNVTIVDHIIISKENYYSYRTNNQIEKYINEANTVLQNGKNLDKINDAVVSNNYTNFDSTPTLDSQVFEFPEMDRQNIHSSMCLNAPVNRLSKTIDTSFENNLALPCENKNAPTLSNSQPISNPKETYMVRSNFLNKHKFNKNNNSIKQLNTSFKNKTINKNSKNSFALSPVNNSTTVKDEYLTVDDLKMAFIKSKNNK